MGIEDLKQCGASVIAAIPSSGPYTRVGAVADRAPTYKRKHRSRFVWGAALNCLERFEEALASFDKAIAIKPDHADAFYNRGVTLQQLKRFDEALASYDKAIAIEPVYANAYNNRGVVLRELKRFDEALASFDKAIAIRPDHAGTFSNRGDTLRTLGRLDEAIGAFEQAIALAPKNVNNHFNLATSRRVNAADPHFAIMKELARNVGSFEAEDQIKLHFALGKAFADVGDPDRSFHHFLQGNSLKRQQITYDEAKTLTLFKRIQSAFTAELMRDRLGVGDPSRVPVFIVGMPRSGTTLIEQILASHPKVFGAGELAEFNNLVANIGATDGPEFPEAVSAMSDEQLRRSGRNYLQSIRGMAPMAERIVDKMPANFLYLGLMHLVLPNAHIIHACRDPRDTALSCFSILFAEGQLGFTYDLVELGRYIRAYQVLMEHWGKVLPAGAILDVQYEELVEDIEGEARRIVTYCGLEWNDACLDFHRTSRIVETASAIQVRQPVYRTSVGRWREYADDLLQPLLRLLAEPGHPAGSVFNR